MKLLINLSILCFISSCCIIGKRDCMGFDNQFLFRLQNNNGQNLVFGPFKQYPLHSISAFSIKNNDSVFHQLFYQVIDNNDTVISAIFNYERNDEVFIRLGTSGINRLVNTTRSLTAKCCDNYDEIVPSTFNGKTILSADNVNILVK